MGLCDWMRSSESSHYKLFCVCFLLSPVRKSNPFNGLWGPVSLVPGCFYLSLCLLWLKALSFLVPSVSVRGLGRLSLGACSFPIPGPIPPSFLYPESPWSLTSLKSAPASAHLIPLPPLPLPSTWRARAFRLTVCVAELQQGKTKSDLDRLSLTLSTDGELSMVFLVCLQLDWVS